jgi:hypothetical protein
VWSVPCNVQLNDDMSAATAEHSDIMSDIDAEEALALQQQEQLAQQLASQGPGGRPVSPSFSALQDKLVQLSANRDEAKIAAQQEVVNKLQVGLPSWSLSSGIQQHF